MTDLYLQAPTGTPRHRTRRVRCGCAGTWVHSTIIVGTVWRNGQIAREGVERPDNHYCTCTALTEHESGVCYLCRQGVHGRLKLESTGALPPGVRQKMRKNS